MNATDSGDMIACFLMVLCVPQITKCLMILSSDGDWLLTQAESDMITLMVLPLIAACLLSWLVMGLGHWIDSGGLDV